MKLTIDVRDVKVVLTPGQQVSWNCEGCEESLFRVRQDAEAIDIVQEQNVPAHTWKRFRFHVGAMPTLTVTVPACVNEVDVRVASGKARVEDLELRSLDVCAGNGKATVKRVQAIRVKVEADNGAAQVDAVTAHQLVVSCKNGAASLVSPCVSESCLVETLNGAAEVIDIRNDTFGYHVEAINGTTHLYGKRHSGSATKPGVPTYTVNCHNGSATLA